MKEKEEGLPNPSTLIPLLGFQLIEDMWEYIESKYKLRQNINLLC